MSFSYLLNAKTATNNYYFKRIFERLIGHCYINKKSYGGHKPDLYANFVQTTNVYNIHTYIYIYYMYLYMYMGL